MIKSLQGFRFLFALMIFFHHFIVPVIGSLGLFPVVFFFILSGFVMSSGYQEKVQNGELVYKKFIKRRFARIYPIHLTTLFIALFLTISVCVKEHVGIVTFVHNLAVYIPNVLLIHSWFPIKSVFFSGNPVSWYLADTLFFYLLFPLLIKLLCNNRYRIFVLLGFLAYICVLSLIPQEWCHALIYINPVSRLFDFMLGIILYNCYLSIIQEKNNFFSHISTLSKSMVEVVTIFISVVAIVCYPYVVRWLGISILFWIPTCLIILVFALSESSGGGILTKLLSSQIMVHLGTVSFPFFMFHVLIIKIYRIIVAHVNIDIGFIPSALLLIILTLCISYLYMKTTEPYIIKLFTDEKK